MRSRDDLLGDPQIGGHTAPRFTSAAATLAALLTIAIAGCGDAPIGQAQARIDMTRDSGMNSANQDSPYSHIRPASIDDPIDPKQLPDIAG